MNYRKVTYELQLLVAVEDESLEPPDLDVAHANAASEAVRQYLAFTLNGVDVRDDEDPVEVHAEGYGKAWVMLATDQE